MATCTYCDRDMSTADGCTLVAYNHPAGDGAVARIPWGEGTSVERFGPASADNTCDRCGHPLGSNLYHPACVRERCPEPGCYYSRQVPDKRGPRLPQAEVRCGDCGAKWGQPHHPGCDLEECPICHGQAIGCGCFDADEGADWVLR